MMQCVETEDSEDLLKFRENWRKELTKQDGQCEGNHKNRSSPFLDQRKRSLLGFEVKDNILSKNSAVSSDLFGDDLSMAQTQSSGDEKDYLKQSKTLFNLPNPVKKLKTKENITDQEKWNGVCQGEEEEKNLLEQLISDIDEITAIPFFDLQLPREVGIKIFSHLGVQDLCACAQVSKSWKCLAEDQLLWYHAGHKKGYIKKEGHQVVDRTSWKHFVQDCVLMDRSLKKNWRERTCNLSVLEFEKGGSLCAASHHRHLICSGYSNGSVLLWDTTDDGISYRMLETSHEIQQNKHQVTCTAVAETICAAGFGTGDINIWHTSLHSSPLHHYRCEGAVKMVAMSTDHKLSVLAASDREIRVDVADGNGQWQCLEQRVFENRIEQVQFLPLNPKTTEQLVAIATVDTLSLLTPGQETLLEVDHVVGGKLSCLDCSADLLAVGAGSYGYGILGNKVRLYCSHTGKMISLLSGHQREISCLNLANSPPHFMVSGGHDWRVCVYDLRSAETAFSLRGHNSSVTAVQMDDWKVVSGSRDGSLRIWDQRMVSTLWMTHARHPVDLCYFSDVRLLTTNVPVDKNPRQNMRYADDPVLHRRHRGVIRIFDFRTENSTLGIPEICSSRYDDTSGYNYNINLIVPYDDM